MFANKILHAILSLTTFVVVPVQLVTTFVLGILVSLTFGLFLLPLSIIWIILFLGPLLGLSYVYELVPVFRPLISLVGIPLATIGDMYVSLIPSMGEMDSRYSKMLYCQTFPYTWEFHKVYTKKRKANKNLSQIYHRLDPVLHQFAINLSVQSFDAQEGNHL